VESNLVLGMSLDRRGIRALAVLLGVAVPEISQAGMRKCEDHFLDADDDMRLRAAALKVLPKSAHLDEVGASRNPRRADAWISTKRVTSTEQVQQWYELTCSRKAQPWKCDAPEFKESLAMSVKVAGVSHLVELSFGKESSQEARVLLLREQSRLTWIRRRSFRHAESAGLKRHIASVHNQVSVRYLRVRTRFTSACRTRRKALSR